MEIVDDNKKFQTIVEDSDGKRYRVRIRKLTPRECGRLMDVPEDVITKMLNTNSKSQCYKQYGNSIVTNVMVYIFKNLFITPEPRMERKKEKTQTLFDLWEM